MYSEYYFSNDSATSVDVEEHLYRLAKDMGITVVTSSQVSADLTMKMIFMLLFIFLLLTASHTIVWYSLDEPEYSYSKLVPKNRIA